MVILARLKLVVNSTAGALLCVAGGCIEPELCPPTTGRVGFFSQGDCALTRASFFQGHEWLSFFGNQDLPEDDRFTPGELQAIAEGNRRVDWPLELLVHLNNSALAYIGALTEHTNRPEIQRQHFLLSDRNDSAEAAAEAHEELARVTREAIFLWISNRARALTLIGQGNHLIQDSFSPAHAVRNTTGDWCIRKVKAFIPRAPNHRGPDIEFHGTDDDTIGHTTTQDSIYREGRDCHEPSTATGVESCLSDYAQRARLATRDYLALVRRLLRHRAAEPEAPDGSGTSETETDAFTDAELDAFSRQHLSLCE